MLAVALAVGWQVLLVGAGGRWRAGLTKLHWVLIVLGSLFFAAGARGPRAALRLARARDAPQPAPAGVPRRRDPRDEDAARVAAPLPRDARRGTIRRRSGAARSSRACTRTSSGSSAPWGRCSRPRARRCGARAPGRAARPDRAPRCVRRGGARPPRARRRGRALRSTGAAALALGDARRARGGVPQPARERGQVLGGSGRGARRACEPLGERPRARRDRRPRHRHPARASCASIFQRFYRAGRDVQRQAAGLGLGLFIVRQPRAAPGRPRARRAARAGPRQPLRGDAARRARRRAAPPSSRGRWAQRMARILVVEDEAHLAEGSRFNLEAEGHEVEIARDGGARRDRLGADRGARSRDPRPDAARR